MTRAVKTETGTGLGAAPVRPMECDGVAVVSPFAWAGPWQTPHYVARQLATRVPVIFVEKPAT